MQVIPEIGEGDRLNLMLQHLRTVWRRFGGARLIAVKGPREDLREERNALGH
jgi:hypothetical protein